MADAVKPAPAKPAATKPEQAKVEAPKPAPAKAEPAKPAVATTPKAPAASGVACRAARRIRAAADANALRDKARAAGFSAFVEQVNTDKGPLNRVRIGPVATRDEAEKLKASVAAKLGVSGMVRPHP
jgi:cell division septation protein DedD